MWWGNFPRFGFFGGGLGSGRLAFTMRMAILRDLDQTMGQCH
jgi:hypothetical protein